MNTKIKKLLFELTRNFRLNTKEIGKKVGISQQSASYLVKNLRKRRTLQNISAIADPIKLGFTNVLVLYDYLKYDPQSKKEVLDLLKTTPEIIGIEEVKYSGDLIVEYAALNLSAFNKTHNEIVSKLNKVLETKFIFPIIVKHEYAKNYLVRKFNLDDMVLCGDRETITLSESEKNVLLALLKKPDSKYIDISKSAKISAKTAVTIKKSLEKRKIIKGYTCTLNNQKLGINRYLFFIKFSGEGIGELNKFREFAKQNRNIVEMVKIIGYFHVMIIGEETTPTNLIQDIRSMFSIDDYSLFKSDHIIRREYVPLELI